MPVNKPHRLVRPLTLVGITAILGGGLSALFLYGPKRQPSVAEPSELALSYLQKGVAANPGNAQDRLKLARMQLSIGQLDEALATLAPLLSAKTPEGREARALAFDVAYRHLGDEPKESAKRPALLQAARDALTRVLAMDGPTLSEAEWEARAKLRLSLDEPAQAALAYEHMATRFPAQSVKWRKEAARWYEATGNLERSAELLYQASHETKDEAQAGELALAGLAKRRAEGPAKSHRAQAEAKEIRERFPASEKVKTGTQGLIDELSFEETKPKGDDARLRDLLGKNRIKPALELLKKMVRDRPNDPARRRWLALVARWNDQPALALENWYALAQQGNAEGLREALPLARVLQDHEKVAGLLVLKAKADGLSPEEVYELAERHETLGSPEAALAALEKYGAALRSDPRYFRTRLALQEARDKPDDAFAEIQAMETATGLTVDDVVQGATLLWKHDQAPRALEFARSHRVLATPSDNEFWRLLGDIAYAESAFPEAQQAYAILARSPSANPPRVVFERLLQFAVNDEHLEDQVEFATKGYARHQEAEWLLSAMDAAYTKDRWDKLSPMIAVAKKDEPRFSSFTLYWRILAAAAERDGKPGEAEQYLKRALGPGEHTGEIHGELLRLAVTMKNKETTKARLAAYGTELAKDPAAYATLHEAYELVGDTERSEFFRRQARNYELNVDEASLKRPANTRTNKDGALLPADARLEMATEENDRKAMKAVLDEPGEGPSKAARIEAEHVIGRDERAVPPLLSLESEAKAGGKDSPAAKLLDTELEATHHDVLAARGGRVGAEVGILELGDLRIDEAKAVASLPWTGLPGAVGVEAGYRRLVPKDELAMQVDGGKEIFLGGTFRRDVWWGATDLKAGVLVLDDKTTAQARLVQSIRPNPKGGIELGGFYHQETLHSSLLRRVGFESGVSLAIQQELFAKNRVEMSMEGLRFGTHTDGLIAWGMLGRCGDAQEWDLGPVHVSVEANGEFLITRKAKTIPAGLPVMVDEFDTLLPDEYLMAGVGAVVTNDGHAVGSGVGRPGTFHYSVEGQGGLLWPNSKPWGGAAGGIGFLLPHWQEIFLRGHYYTSYGGIAGQRYAGLTMGYVIRFL